MAHHTQTPPDTTSTPASRMVAALTDPDRLFTCGEVAYLMSVAGRWSREDADDSPSPQSWRAGYAAGYRARVDEENAAYPSAPVFAFGEWLSMAERQACRDRAAADRTQRYAGGAVPVWPATRPDHVSPAGVSVRVVRSSAGWVWRDA